LNDVSGGVSGQVRFVNVGDAECTLVGRPHITLRDVNGAVIHAMSVAGPAEWQRRSGEAPAGWPSVGIAPQEAAQSLVTLRNWCRQPNELVFLHIELPGVPGHRTMSSTRITAPCANPQEPTSLSVGPFEPTRPR
jgi:hypothetical protein